MTRLDDVHTELWIVDGRVTMDATGDADLYVSTPNHGPLTRGQTHATLTVAGDGCEAMVKLDADDCEALATALEAAPDVPDDGGE